MNRILTSGFLSLIFLSLSCGKSKNEVFDNAPTVINPSEKTTAVTAVTSFVHPGLLNSLSELNAVKSNQTTEPWKSELAALKASASGNLSYTMKGPFSAISRGATNTGWTQHGQDATACYVQAALGYITGDTRYTQKAISLINAWSSTLTSVSGADVELLVGIQAPLWAQAGEILAYTNTGWQSTDITRARNMMTNIFLPAIVGFSSSDGANFSASCVYATMAMAVFTNNTTKFNEAWAAFISQSGCPNDYSLYKNIAANGQNVESGRDQIHSWSSYEMLAGTAEIAYHQGLDPYTLGSNRLLTGVEYWCKYNLGNSVPYDVSIYRCRAGWGPWSQISATGRGVPTTQGSVCNMVYRAYSRLNSVPSTSYTKLMANAMANKVVDPTSANGWGNPFIGDGLLHSYASSSQVIANGTYSLRNRASGKMLDNYGATTDGAIVKQYVDGTSNNQKWTVTYTGGYYKLICVTGGKALDSNNNTADGSTVHQWASGSSPNQQWTIEDIGGGFFKILNRANGKCLDTGGGTIDGANMQFWPSNTSINQQWAFVAP